MRPNHRRCYGGLLVLLIAMAGCGSSDGLVAVAGSVTLDGRPLEGATVQFIAQQDVARDAIGTTNDDGQFTLTTFKPGDGALPGNYKVVIRPATPASSQPPAASPMEAMGVAASSKPAGLVLPARYSQPGETVLVQKVPPEGDVVFELQSK